MASDRRQRALITGASSGIGYATAIAFAQAGMDVALVSRSKDKLVALAAELQDFGVQAKPYGLDLSQLDQVEPGLQGILADFGGVDILVNNAGMGYTGALAETPWADFQRVFDLNVTSVLLCIQAVLPGMRDRGYGTILNVASIAAHHAFPDWGAYSASKAALVSLSRVLAAEVRPQGIRVTVVSPGSVNTPLWDTDTVQADFPRSGMLTPDIVAQTLLYAVRLPASAVIDELTLMPSGGAL